MAIVEEDIERIRSSVSVADIIGQWVQLRRVGRNLVGLCPFHNEKSGSFNVREEIGRYHCFGCGASGDVFTFVQTHEHLDFVDAVEWLATKAGVQLRYTTGGEGQDRLRRKRLVDAMAHAVDWYHDRLLNGADARAARDYLRSRGLAGDVARQFKIGWAPEGWDEFARSSNLPGDVLRETGLAFVNKRDRLTDSFRGRVLFPIFSENGDAVALGGRILPGSSVPAKYKNSPETAIYAKSRTLYGLNWAKADVVAADQVVVCEGYTDVIGFHRAGINRAVATCGTAFTEDHVRLLKRYARRVVLAFDADAAGQGAAERFYEWERTYDIEVSVVRLPTGMDPGELGATDPSALRAALDTAMPFLGFRLDRLLRSAPISTPEGRAKVAATAMNIVNEHPDVNVRTIYAGQVASHTGLPAADLVGLAKVGGRRVRVNAPIARRSTAESAEVVALAMLLVHWEEVAPWLIEPLFVDDICLGALRALAETNGDFEAALDRADPEVRELLERVAVLDVDVSADVEIRNLIGAATRREVDRLRVLGDLSVAHEIATAKQLLEQLEGPVSGPEAASGLLTWLVRGNEERT